jgi:RHS repeat-associated protein
MPGGTAEVWQASGSSPYYQHSDWIRSSRFASTYSRTMYSDLAYAPFGETYAPSGSTGVTNISFAGNSENTTTNLYDAANREYEILGRWPSPDPAGIAAANPTNPQSWNRYAYVMNNPLASIDPTGLGSMGCLAADPVGSHAHIYCADTPFGGGSGDDGGGGDGSGIDGGFGPSALAGSSYASAQCPNNSCNAVNNFYQYTEFQCDAGGNCGYVSQGSITGGCTLNIDGCTGYYPQQTAQQSAVTANIMLSYTAPQSSTPQTPNPNSQPPSLWYDMYEGAVIGGFVGGATGCVVGALPGSVIGSVFGGPGPGTVAGGLAGCGALGFNGIISGAVTGAIGGAIDYWIHNH